MDSVTIEHLIAARDALETAAEELRLAYGDTDDGSALEGVLGQLMTQAGDGSRLLTENIVQLQDEVD